MLRLLFKLLYYSCKAVASLILGLLICIFKCVQNPAQENEDEQIDLSVYTDIEAGKKQLAANIFYIKQIEHELKISKNLGKCADVKMARKYKQIADLEATNARIEKRIRKLATKNNIEIDI